MRQFLIFLWGERNQLQTVTSNMTCVNWPADNWPQTKKEFCSLRIIFFPSFFPGHSDVVRLMLDKGAQKNLKAPGGGSYLDAAEKEDIKAMLRWSPTASNGHSKCSSNGHCHGHSNSSKNSNHAEAFARTPDTLVARAWHSHNQESKHILQWKIYIYVFVFYPYFLSIPFWNRCRFLC